SVGRTGTFSRGRRTAGDARNRPWQRVSLQRLYNWLRCPRPSHGPSDAASSDLDGGQPVRRRSERPPRRAVGVAVMAPQRARTCFLWFVFLAVATLPALWAAAEQR